jgi:hypothetical protein
MLSKYEVGGGTTSGLNFNLLSKKAEVSGGLQTTTNQTMTYDLRGAAGSAREALQRLGQSNTNLQKMLPGYQTKPQGFDSTPSGAGIDDGDWPFEAVFGLAYPVAAP